MRAHCLSSPRNSPILHLPSQYTLCVLPKLLYTISGYSCLSLSSLCPHTRLPQLQAIECQPDEQAKLRRWVTSNKNARLEAGQRVEPGAKGCWLQAPMMCPFCRVTISRMLGMLSISWWGLTDRFSTEWQSRSVLATPRSCWFSTENRNYRQYRLRQVHSGRKRLKPSLGLGLLAGDSWVGSRLVGDVAKRGVWNERYFGLLRLVCRRRVVVSCQSLSSLTLSSKCCFWRAQQLLTTGCILAIYITQAITLDFSQCTQSLLAVRGWPVPWSCLCNQAILSRLAFSAYSVSLMCVCANYSSQRRFQFRLFSSYSCCAFVAPLCSLDKSEDSFLISSYFSIICADIVICLSFSVASSDSSLLTSSFRVLELYLQFLIYLSSLSICCCCVLIIQSFSAMVPLSPSFWVLSCWQFWSWLCDTCYCDCWTYYNLPQSALMILWDYQIWLLIFRILYYLSCTFFCNYRFYVQNLVTYFLSVYSSC